MSCHKSCLGPCIEQIFTKCPSCQGTNILFNSVCYCSYPWSNDCTSETVFQGIFRSLQSIFILLFILLIVLYNLKIKLPVSYRIVNGLQAISCILYSRVIYLDYEDFFVLRYFNLLSGPYQIQYRLQNLSTQHALQTYILFGFFMFLLFFLYIPAQIFYKKAESFWGHIKQNLLEYFENFYYFGGKMMFLYIGMFMQSVDKGVMIIIIHMAIFCVLICAVIVRLIMQYHKNSLSQQIFQGPLYVYAMIVNSAIIGIPLINQSTMLIIVYLGPLGLLLLIAILNKEVKIVDKTNMKFFIVEIVMAGLAVAIILFDSLIQTYVLLIVQIVSVISIIVEMSFTYYDGIDLAGTNSARKSGRKSNKVQPIENEFFNYGQIESKKSIQFGLEAKYKKGKFF